MSATGADHRTSSQKAEETDVLKEKLHGWRAAILTTDCFLCWEKLYYPVVLLVVVSIKFLLVYWLDPSILTGLSTLVMFVCLADYMVPIVTERFFGPDMYLHEQQQQRFHEICSQLVQSKHAARAVFDSLCTLRQERPRMYYITVLLLLALVAWIGHQIHNLLLTYLLVVFGLMLPGLNQHGFVSKYSSMVWQEIDKLAKRKEKSQ